MAGEELTVRNTTLRPGLSTKSFYEVAMTNSSSHEIERDTSNSVPGRHLNSRPGRSQVEEDTNNSSRDLLLTGVCHQYKEVYFRTSTNTGVPGFLDRFSKNDNTTSPQESCQDQERVSTHDHLTEKVGSSHWSVDISPSTCSNTSLQGPSVDLK